MANVKNEVKTEVVAKPSLTQRELDDCRRLIHEGRGLPQHLALGLLWERDLWVERAFSAAEPVAMPEGTERYDREA